MGSELQGFETAFGLLCVVYPLCSLCLCGSFSPAPPHFFAFGLFTGGLAGSSPIAPLLFFLLQCAGTSREVT